MLANESITGVFKLIQKDEWLSIVTFLNLKDFISILSTCKFSNFLLGTVEHGTIGIGGLYWNALFERHFLPKNAVATEAYWKYPFTINTDAKEFVKSCFAELKEGGANSLCQDVVALSSIDRREERGRNVLNRSFCLDVITSLTATPIAANISSVQIGQHSQWECACATTRPCYWSCKPSTSENQTEYLQFKLYFPVSIIFGFSLTPYQAFFQPAAPCYAPQEVILQLLLPDKNPIRATEKPQRLEADQLYSDQVYYQSPPFNVDNAFRRQAFMLPIPILCLHGQARLLMRNMVQRQTLGQVEPGEDVVAHATDYYICLSHCEILGLHLPEYTSELKSQRPGTHLTEASSVQIPDSCVLSFNPAVTEHELNEIHLCTRVPPHDAIAIQGPMRQLLKSFFR